MKAQLTVATGALTPTQYVQNVLVGAGVTVSNVNYYGHPSQIGTFNGVGSSIGLTDGLILSTGDVTTVQTGNFPDTDIEGVNGVSPNWGGGNPDLLTVAQSVTTNPDAVNISALKDMAMLEFDFVPTGDTVSFNFVFASEEYTGFINSIYNDVFGFFISGPGLAGPFAAPVGFPGGAENIALVPGTNLPITISTIYSDPFQTPPTLNDQFYIDNANDLTHELNGFTTVLTATSAVQCGELYHIRIAIADAEDGSLDSDVFLQAGSFSSNTVILNSSVDVGGNDSVLYEGCGIAFLDFIRSDTTDTAVYNYAVVGGTASAGDYTINADSVVFLPGQDTVTLSFEAIQDGLTEPLETVTIELVQTICSVVDTQRITFYISDFPIPVLTTHDTLKACGSSDSVPVWVNVLGPPHTISWNTIPVQITDTIWVNPAATQEYIVTVSDTCGVYTIVDTAEVLVVPPTPIVLTMSTDSTKYCLQDSIEIYVEPTGGGGDFTYLWSPLALTDTNLFVNPIITTTYVVEVTDLCGTIEKDSVTITVPNFVPLTTNIVNDDDTICSGDLVVLNGGVTGGVDSYFSWGNGLGNVSPVNVNPSVTTTYVLTGQDSCGAVETDTVTISVLPTNFGLNLPDSITFTCLGESVVLDPAITGGAGNETYLWRTGEISETITVAPITPITYKVTVTTADGCSSSSDSTKVIPQIFLPVVLEINLDLSIVCPGDPVVLFGTIYEGSGNPLTINWTNGTDTFVGNNITVNPLVTSTYTAWVNDTCAQDYGASDSFTVTSPSYPPLVFNSFSEDMLICLGSQVKLGGLVSGGNNLLPYSYLWSNTATSDSILVTPTFSRGYSVVITDGCGTQIDTSVYISVSAPDANFTFEYQTATEVQFYDSSYSNIVSYYWSFDNGSSNEENPLHNFSYDGAHEVWLVVRDTNNCLDSILKTVKPPLLVYSPNSFTPDDDGLNEEFRFRGVGIKSFKMLIYNRWGELMFQSENIDNGWDGTYKGKGMPVGIYVYKVRAVNYENIEFEDTGKLMLIK
jgi:gliding motility-associated-like protein